ncbi:hypothetical protein QYM23_10065 [Bacillus cereus]|uniref:Uncharacterized protein n=1 Tax=Bacillus cereus TaxID=1396 RepID=A0AAW7NFB5_BACCE|nr:hypothetical protein [Bacillus cereus]MDN4873203.1 hypothetical protein [Bacillus cereus]
MESVQFELLNGNKYTMKEPNAMQRMVIAGLAGKHQLLGDVPASDVDNFFKSARKQAEGKKLTDKENSSMFNFAMLLNNKILMMMGEDAEAMFNLMSGMSSLPKGEMKELCGSDFDIVFNAFKRVGGISAFMKSVTNLSM